MAEEDADRRRELGRFLRSRREQAIRADHGLPPIGRSRDRGLRREEVAVLAGVSVTWYTWVEQGRPIRPSQSVLDAVARALRLTRAEHEFVVSLAGPGLSAPDRTTAVEDAPPHLQRLLDALDPNPAFALAPDWGIAGWNAGYQHLYPNVAAVPRPDRNLLWAVFTDPTVRQLLPDWGETSRQFLGEFRAETGGRSGDPAVRALVERLSAVSPEFRDAWDRYDVRGFASRERRFRTADGGTARFEHHQLTPTDHPDLRLVVYTRLP
ncbi:helix-turn-helix domain-containing protein [Nakamurella flava]|uniref:Helix-turn-helix domain-containing protein n=1 Tax=Nakamurella flava TaxID=2576308 RepID=A0A4U6QE73_9ACTN|nr:helix-turn-helix transcriptional regulator [Nakamurella flava]TKV58292.1 helix-turn-helix domain-containing protein [Nakamurella flava]